jgi:RNA polymerase sigma-70 factor, ECF subfamily
MRPSTDGGFDQEFARRALLTLPPKFQTVLSLHYLEGLDLKAVATVLGCRVGTVKSRLARAREALREALNRRR